MEYQTYREAFYVTHQFKMLLVHFTSKMFLYVSELRDNLQKEINANLNICLSHSGFKCK